MHPSLPQRRGGDTLHGCIVRVFSWFFLCRAQRFVLPMILPHTPGSLSTLWAIWSVSREGRSSLFRVMSARTVRGASARPSSYCFAAMMGCGAASAEPCRASALRCPRLRSHAFGGRRAHLQAHERPSLQIFRLDPSLGAASAGPCRAPAPRAPRILFYALQQAVVLAILHPLPLRMVLRACQRDVGMHACSTVLHLFSFFLPSLPSLPILYCIFSFHWCITNPTLTFIFYRSPFRCTTAPRRAR
jgi:hypothetical protein